MRVLMLGRGTIAASLAAHTDPAAPEAVAVLDDTRRSAREHGIAVPGLGAR